MVGFFVAYLMLRYSRECLSNRDAHVFNDVLWLGVGRAGLVVGAFWFALRMNDTLLMLEG